VLTVIQVIFPFDIRDKWFPHQKTYRPNQLTEQQYREFFGIVLPLYQSSSLELF